MHCPVCSASNIPKALSCRSCGASLRGAAQSGGPAHLPVGTKLQGGQFSVGKIVQQDDLGFTYLGGDARVQRLIAIREFFPTGSTRQGHLVYHSDLTAYNEAKRHFLREAQILLHLSHANLAKTLAAFEESNTAYFITEQPVGKTLAALLQERSGPLNEVEALIYIEKIGNALVAAHDAGLWHGDLKPDHVLLGPNHQLTLTSFRVGSTWGVKGAGHNPTGTRLISRYAAPEYYWPQPQLSARTDVYGLAALLYHLLTGNAPIAATARSKSVALKEVRSLNPQVRASVAQAIMEGLAMEVSQRPASIAIFLDRLKNGQVSQSASPVTFKLAPASPPPTTAAPTVTASSRLPHDFLQRTAAAPVNSVSSNAIMPSTPPMQISSGFRPTSATVGKLTGHVSRVSSVAFSPVGGLLAAGGEDGVILVWDTLNGTLKHALPEALPHTIVGTVTEARLHSLNDTLALAQTVRHSVQSTIKGQVKRVSAVAFSPDGRLLACGNEDGTVTLWNTQTGKLSRTLKGHVGRVTAVAFAPGGDLLASASSDSTAILWDLMQNKPRQTWTDHGTGVSAVAFSPDGRMLATASPDIGVIVWELQTRKILRTLKAPEHEVTALAFAPNSRLLASGSYDKTVLLWDMAVDQPLWTLTGHTGGVTSVAFSPDSHILASGSYDKTVRLWDALTGEMALLLSEHWASVNAVAFAPNGKTVATGILQEVWLWSLS